ncbi:MAG: PRC-barrel domain containing protein [Alphaproteobacteria bacterium]|nr:PRC-barrel domain containing protein [Alphaproteobacteria bacterium]
MRKLLLTTAFAIPMSFGAALAQDTPPADDPAMAPADTAPMASDPMADPATSTATDPAADPMATETEAQQQVDAGAVAEKVEMQQAPNEWRVDWITGTSVTSPDGTNIGSITDLIVDGDTGEMKAAIVGVGGFLGIGQKDIALPWNELTVNSDAQEITADLTREEADAAPEYVFRDRESATGDTMADPSATTADPMATGTTAPAADPMATGTTTTTTEPMTTETTTAPAADPMATDTTTTEPMTDAPADTGTTPMTDEPATTEGTAPAN